MNYIDDYGTCEKTYATLCIYPHKLDPEIISQHLNVRPSRWQRKGEYPHQNEHTARLKRRAKPAQISGWFLSSEQYVTSRDCRRHIDWLLDQVSGRDVELHKLQESECSISISCFWASAVGHGGPTLSPSQMQRLATLNIELGFDFYEADDID